jgi:hypothetical protein
MNIRKNKKKLYIRFSNFTQANDCLVKSVKGISKIRMEGKERKTRSNTWLGKRRTKEKKQNSSRGKNLR